MKFDFQWFKSEWFQFLNIQNTVADRYKEIVVIMIYIVKTNKKKKKEKRIGILGWEHKKRNGILEWKIIIIQVWVIDWNMLLWIRQRPWTDLSVGLSIITLKSRCALVISPAGMKLRPLTVILGPTSFSICSWHLRDWHVPLSLQHLLQALLSDYIKRFQTLNKTESPIDRHKRKGHDNISLRLFGLGDCFFFLSLVFFSHQSDFTPFLILKGF